MSGSAILQLPGPLQAAGSTHRVTQAAQMLDTCADQNLRHASANARHALYPPGLAESPSAASLPMPSETASTTTDAFQDLDHFIALGCLHINGILPRSRGPFLEGVWAELLKLPDETKLVIGEQAARLLESQWVRLFLLQPGHDGQSLHNIVRVYLLPEDWNRRIIDRRSQSLRKALQQLLALIDTSATTWAGNYQGEIRQFDPWASAENVSLYYLFNKLPSPAPDPAIIKDRFTRAAVRRLLESAAPSKWEEHGGQPLAGLRTRLYPYQARSASLMIQREAAPQLQLDPRLEIRTSPNGKLFYFGARDGSALQEPRYYEATRGGILAETMGLGKTLCCLAVVLTTWGQYPQIPAPYIPSQPVRNRVGRLSDMAASILGRRSIPAKAMIEEIEMAQDIDHALSKDALDRNLPFYEIPHVPTRLNRSTEIPPPRQLLLCSGTIIVVPKNLLHQWQSEIRKHVLPGGLNILVVDTLPSRSKVKFMHHDDDTMTFVSELPSPTELMKYDVVLFTRPRFEKEIEDGTDDIGRRLPAGVARVCNCPYIGSTRIPDCNCVGAATVYESPLRKLHWLRIIIDEGHSFSSSVSNAVLVAKQIHAERRWIVSGTPAKNLVGVELDMTMLESDSTDVAALRESAIEQRKTFSLEDTDRKAAVKALGSLTANFLMARPWHGSPIEGKLDWDAYVYRHEHRHERTYSGFSSCFLRTLEGLIIKTRPEDVEKDIVLPPMTHRVVYLKPCWYDKMTANLFVQVLRANAITSERSDVDYLFHKNSAKARHSLIRNLRQSNFTWTGFSIEDVMSTLETTQKYLGKEDKKCSLEDKASLLESSQNVSRLTDSEEWVALSKAHEVGMAIQDWPKESEQSFALAYPSQPAMVGITQLLAGQSHVDSNVMAQDPAQGLDAVGQAAKARIDAMADAVDETKETKNEDVGGSLPKPGVPPSCLGNQQTPTSQRVSVVTSKMSSQKDERSEDIQVLPKAASPLRPKKRKATLTEEHADLAADSPLRNTRVIATTSAKLTYLLDKVVEHQATEKIIVFYDGDNAAFYISQCLDMLYINHRIYARTLENVKRSEYVKMFNEESDVRVLLIDVACGALGLNLNVASVVLIVNPFNRPGLEAQAIKRAHRIGQNKRVIVETLVLENTIEHAIFKHAKKMSRAQHLEVKDLEDDAGILQIIQNAQIQQITPEEEEGAGKFATLKTPQQVFGRPDRHKYHGQIDSKPQGQLKKKAKTASKSKSTSKKGKAKSGDAQNLVDMDIQSPLAYRSGGSTPASMNSQDRVADPSQPISSIFGSGHDFNELSTADSRTAGIPLRRITH